MNCYDNIVVSLISVNAFVYSFTDISYMKINVFVRSPGLNRTSNVKRLRTKSLKEIDKVQYTGFRIRVQWGTQISEAEILLLGLYTGHTMYRNKIPRLLCNQYL